MDYFGDPNFNLNRVVTTGSTDWQLGQAWNGWPPQQPLPAINTWTIATPPQPQKEQAPMRGLFEVFIVDPFGQVNKDGLAVSQAGDVAYECKVVADSDGSAKLKALMAFQSADDLAHYRGRDIDDFDIIVRRLGDVRQKRKVQEVKVVE